MFHRGFGQWMIWGFNPSHVKDTAAMAILDCNSMKSAAIKTEPRFSDSVMSIHITSYHTSKNASTISNHHRGSMSFATMLMSATLDRLSIPASMKGLSSSSSSSLAMAS